ncbi:hypothetical protein TTHERM_001109849 (macronuclear) [Tetrahymena thermophila SB210]|uniref:FHA domain-containing protein n=1 Tax=Tetrahymena thermophila (strain SB210) TaxID=312017 RepID=W7X133_TETTS|nr:hypothetical protein TTHERM_001109849 [Tetrahymena thermophila SB210]EWS72880.1 hypothetical protein TTHERM_001109849 [Tetrahymena thermophila SB210]|eukprot:XP_012654587.1 hypothetical protein TTHERM_001109849 [Tetrahymena thermophila SB210]
MQYQNSPTYSQYIGSYQQTPYVSPIYQRGNHLLSTYQSCQYRPLPVEQRVVYNNFNPQVQLPPPVQPSQKVFYPTNNIVSWHPLEAKIQNENSIYQNYYQDPYIIQQQNQFQQDQNKQYYNQQFSNEKNTLVKQKIESSKSSKISIKDNLDDTPKFATNKLAQMIKKSKQIGGINITDQLIGDELIEKSQKQQEDAKSENYNNNNDDSDSNESEEEYEDDQEYEDSQSEKLFQSSLFNIQNSQGFNRKGNNYLYGSNLAGLRNDKITDYNRFETLNKFEKINKQHANLFANDFKEDLQMKDIFGDNTLYIDNFNLSKTSGTVPSFIWHRTRNNISQNILREEEELSSNNGDDNDDYEHKNMLWEARYQKIHEHDYMVSYANNIFNRKSNYLKLGLFYKQALIKYQFDRSKEIVYYMYSYDEYSIKKKKSEMTQDQQGINEDIEIKINTLEDIDQDDEDEQQNNMQELSILNSSQKQNKDLLQVTQLSKSKSGDHDSSKQGNQTQKSVVFNQQNKSRILNNSQLASSNLKSKVLTTTTYNKQDLKSQIKDQYDFSKSNFLRDYEKTHFGQSIMEEGDEQESKSMNKSQLSLERTNSNNTSQYSDNYSKLYKSRPASQRKKVVEKKSDDLSKIKNKKNKYRLWEKNAVSEDKFLDQVRDSTIEAVKRARNMEQAIVEKTSIFEHHAASLLNQHLSQLRKVSKEQKKELYLKVRDIIQCIYDEYRDIINFESNNTYVMLVCDKKDNDRILGLHYYGYQGKRYFEKYFDQFVTFSKTRKEFEEKRYQAFLLNKQDESYCKQHFLN